MILRALLFFLCFALEIQVVEAEEFMFYAEKPDGCVNYQTAPCIVSSGDKPHYFLWDQSRWEMHKKTLLMVGESKTWIMNQGTLVLKAKGEVTIKTPFARVIVKSSGIFLKLSKDRLIVRSLSGRGVQVFPRSGGEVQYITPGFENWYSGIGPKGQEMGVPNVINLQYYAKERAYFFTDHKLGFVNELKQLARVIKKATHLAAMMHKSLVERKMASLQDQHLEKLGLKRKRIQFNKYLRWLFLQKLRYDY